MTGPEPSPHDALLERHAALRTDSAAEVWTNSILFDRVDHMEALDPRSPFRMAINSVMIDDIRISAVSTSGHRISVIDEGVALLLPWQGTLETDHDGGRTAVRRGGMLIPTIGPRTTLCSTGYVGLVLQIPLPRMRRLAVENPEDKWRPDGPAPGMIDATVGEGASFARYLRHLVLEISESNSLLKSARARDAAVVLLTELLRDAWRTCASTTLPPLPSASLRQVARAEALMREKIGETLSVADIACKIGVSTRALQLAFQKHREQGPRQALEAIRLDAAHARLLGASPEDHVTQIALDCGVTHLGRFSARYRARFGEAPRATLRRKPGRG